VAVDRYSVGERRRVVIGHAIDPGVYRVRDTGGAGAGARIVSIGIVAGIGGAGLGSFF
jgi:hypothetical protein